MAQDAGSALNPARRIGSQIEEILVVNRGLSSEAARRRTVKLLEAVRLPDAARARRRYPHEFSGDSSSGSPSRWPSPPSRE